MKAQLSTQVAVGKKNRRTQSVSAQNTDKAQCETGPDAPQSMENDIMGATNHSSRE